MLYLPRREWSYRSRHETLEKMARAFEVPLYQLFYEGEEPPKVPTLLKQKSPDEGAWGSSGKRCAISEQAPPTVGQANEQDRKLILHMAQKMARR